MSEQKREYRERRRKDEAAFDKWDGNGSAAPDGPLGSGKWMVFVDPEELDVSWALVKAATEKGALGPLSKTGTAQDNDLARTTGKKVIIVYTSDADDHADLRRVLAELRRLGFSGWLNYKLDADSVRISGAGASLYTSPPGSLDFHTPTTRLKRNRREAELTVSRATDAWEAFLLRNGLK